MTELTTDGEKGMRTEARDRGLTIGWPTLSVALGVLAAACLGTLAVVATIRDADMLSTVALALAVISFAAQVVVSLAQSRAGAQQLAQAERTHNETRSLLYEVSARASALLANQSQQFDRVLDAALEPSAIRRAIQASTPGAGMDEPDQVAKDTGSVSPDPAELSSNLEAALRDQFKRTLAGRADWSVAAPQLAREPLPLVAEAKAYPDEKEGRAAYEDLMKLSPVEASVFTRRALEDFERAKDGRPRRGFMAEGTPMGATYKHLEELGLMAFEKGVAIDGRRGTWRRITERGWLVARLLIADGPAPDWLRDLHASNAGPEGPAS